MKPIVLTEFGETLSESIQKEDLLLNKDAPIGFHEVCKGFIDLKVISETHQALFCRVCHLRIVLPREIDTYRKLREYCTKQITDRAATERIIGEMWDNRPPVPDGPLPEIDD